MSQSLVQRASLTDRTVAAGRETLAGRRRGLRGFLPFAGPAVIASIAYMDPGNFATNIQGGAQFGYLLLWVVLLANLVAMLFQALSAKLGIVTGRSLAQLCRTHFPRPLVYAMWVASEVAAMATDLAESLGAAIGLSLLFGLPLLTGLLITFALTYGMLLLQGRGFRPIEMLIAAFIGVIAVCYLIELFVAPPDWRAFAYHAVVPQLRGTESVMLAVGIIGATVMPHAIYLHSSLTQGRMPARTDVERRRIIGFSNREVLFALGVAGLVNMAMLAMAASGVPSGPRRGRLDRDRIPYVEAAAWHRRGGGVHGFAAGIRAVEFGGRHDGRPDDHAGFCPVSYSAVGAAVGHHGSCRDRGGHGRRLQRTRWC